MTSTTAKAEVLKQDSRGRVRVPVERREALLEEFERSGASAAKFARLAGIKYATFAGWVQERRKGRRTVSPKANPPLEANEGVVGAGSIRLFEALVEHGRMTTQEAMGGLTIELPGGSRILIESPGQLQMAAELVSLIAQSARARC